MKLLSRAEEVILLAILKLEGDAYGVSIRRRIFDDTGDWWSFASIYTPLDKLVRKGFARKTKGDPTAKRGGKSKFFYEVTNEGKKALLDLQRAQNQIWTGVPLIAVEILEARVIDGLPGFKKRMTWFLDNRKDLTQVISCMRTLEADDSHRHRLLAIPSRDRLVRTLRYLLDEEMREIEAPGGLFSPKPEHTQGLPVPFV